MLKKRLKVKLPIYPSRLLLTRINGQSYGCFVGGMKLYISDNKVILTEGFDGVVPVEYFERIESWPDRKLITLDQNL